MLLTVKTCVTIQLCKQNIQFTLGKEINILKEIHSSKINNLHFW